MDVRSYSRFRLAILSIVLPIVMAAMLALDTAPAAAARRARHAQAAEASAVPLDQIHVLGNRPAPFGLNAKAAMMIDARSGATLYAYNEHEKIQPASLAKLMTFYLVLKALHQAHGQLATPIRRSQRDRFPHRASSRQSAPPVALSIGCRYAPRTAHTCSVSGLHINIS